MKTKRRPDPPKSPWPMICLMISPLLLLLIFLGWRFSNREEDSAEYRANRILLERRIEDVKLAIQESGAVVHLTPSGTVEVSLPSEHAMMVSERAATELAMQVRNKTGAIVRVVTPAGQVLGQAP